MSLNVENTNKEIQSKAQLLTNEYEKLQRENHKLKEIIKQMENGNSRVKNTIVKPSPHKEAAVFFAADISGSMGSWEKHIGNEFKVKFHNLLSNKYKNVTTRYIHHHTEAELVYKDDFLKTGVTGGTIVSSAYRLINKELEDFDYSNENLDVFVVHISDGDNLTSDNLRVHKLFEKLFKKVNKIIYLETNVYNRRSTILNGLRGLNKEKFTYGVIEKESDVDKYIVELVEDHINKL